MARMFDHEKLDVYRLALRFVAWVDELLDEVADHPARRIRNVSDHLDRASLSILFNTAEGNGKRAQRVRGKFFDDARGSATESAACLDALVAKGVCSPERIGEGKQMAVRVYAMLTKLVQRFSYPDGVAEGHVPYGAAEQDDLAVLEDENEYEDKDEGENE